MRGDMGISIRLIESEYDNEKLFCALCCDHVDKKLFVELFNKSTLCEGLVHISEDDVHHHYAQERCALDGEHLFLGENVCSEEFEESDDYGSPYPVTVIYGSTVNNVYKRLKSRMFFERECCGLLAEYGELAMTLEAYKTYKYDEDYVDLIIYNKTNYAHIVLFDKNISVFNENGDEVMNESFGADNFSELIVKAIYKIK